MKYIYFRESLLQSIISDIISFGFLIFSIWFSRGDNLWTFFCMVLFVIFVIGRAQMKVKNFYSVEDLKKYVEKL